MFAGAALIAVLAGGGGYFSWKRQKDERESRAASGIANALRDARRHEGEQDWAASLAAAQRALDIASSENTDAPRARALYASLQQRRNEADEQARLEQADRRLLEDLENARVLDTEHHGVQARDAAFSNAVRSRWLDGKVDVARLRASPGAAAFATAFDTWSYFRRTKLPDSDWRTADRWARAIDPAHNPIRDAIADDKAKALAPMLKDDLPVAMIALVGAVLIERDEHDTAVRFLQSAHRRHPGDYWIHAQLARAARQAEKIDLSIRHWQAALAIRPRSIQARHYLGIALELAGDIDGALAVWRDGLKIKPDWAHALQHIAPALAKREGPEEALRLLQDMARKNPDDGRCHYLLGQHLLDRVGRPKAALACFDRALELEPDRRQFLDGRAAALLRLGDAAGAEEAIRRTLAVAPEDRSAKSRLARVYMMRGRPKKARTLYLELLEKRKDDPGLLAMLGGVHMALGDLDEAIRLCEKAIRLDARVGVAYSNLGAALSRKYEDRPADDDVWKRVIEVCRKGVEYQPALSSSHNNLGLAYMYARRLDKAIHHLRRACELAPGSHDSRVNLGFAHVLAKRPKDALRVLEEAQRLRPNSMRAWHYYGDALTMLSRRREAAAAYRHAIPVSGADGAWALAIKLTRRGDFEGALAACRRAAEVDPARASRPGAYLCDTMRRYEEAIASFSKVIEKDPENANAQANISVALRRLRRHDESVKAAGKAVAAAPKTPFPYKALAFARLEAGDLDGAREALRQGRALPGGGSLAGTLRWMNTMAAVSERLEKGDRLSAADKAVAARVLLHRGRVVESARLFDAAFREDKSLLGPQAGHFYNAVRAAARAGPEWHEQALGWIRPYRAWLTGVSWFGVKIRDVSMLLGRARLQRDSRRSQPHRRVAHILVRHASPAEEGEGAEVSDGDKSILHRLENAGRPAPRVGLKGTERDAHYENWWPLILAAPVLAWISAYGLFKRFTAACHLYLGSSLAISPVAAAIAVDPAQAPDQASLWLLAGVVLTWVAGFDIIYALQDVEVDRSQGLRSIPARLGPRGALRVSRLLHAGSFAALLAILVLDDRFHVAFAVGIGLVGVLLLIEHATVTRWGTSRMALAFFTINGVISCLLGLLGIADILV